MNDEKKIADIILELVHSTKQENVLVYLNKKKN